MNQQRIAKIQAYVDQLRPILRLADWEIVVSDDRPDDENALAEIQITYGRKNARLGLKADWDERSLESQRHTLVHELIHCHLDPIRIAFTNHHRRFDDMGWAEARAGMIDEMEWATDGLADALAPLVPLPPWKETK